MGVGFAGLASGLLRTSLLPHQSSLATTSKQSPVSRKRLQDTHSILRAFQPPPPPSWFHLTEAAEDSLVCLFFHQVALKTIQQPIRMFSCSGIGVRERCRVLQKSPKVAACRLELNTFLSERIKETDGRKSFSSALDRPQEAPQQQPRPGFSSPQKQ